MSVAIGIDFGTTNSSLALADPDSGVTLATFPLAGGITDAYRSLLYLEQIRQQNKLLLKPWTGPEGIERGGRPVRYARVNQVSVGRLQGARQAGSLRA